MAIPTVGIRKVNRNWQCRINWHSWTDGFSGSLINPGARQCQRCGKTQIFQMECGYVTVGTPALNKGGQSGG